MGVKKRVLLFLTRNKNKTFILFLIFMFISVFILIGLTAEHGVKEAQENLRETMLGYFHIQTDTEHGSAELVDDQLVRQVSELEGVCEYNGLDVVFMHVGDIRLVPGRLTAVGDPDSTLAQVIGNSDSSANEYFALEMFRLISGRHVSSGDKGKAVVSEELAKVNGLSLGDRISLLPNVGKEERETKMGTVEIIGIYEMIDSQKTTDPNMAECDMKENYIFVDTGFVRQVMGEVLGEEITAYSHGAVFYVEDVASLDQIVEQAEEIPGYYWKGYVIEKNNKEYHDLSEPLIRMDRFLMIFIAAMCVCGVIILGLILIMWTRNRLHEAGILLSMGISRYAVAGQYLLENLLVMLGAYPIAWILGFLAVGPIGARMGLELQLDSLSILAAAGIGCGIVTVSTLLASVRIFRMEPKEILSMD